VVLTERNLVYVYKCNITDSIYKKGAKEVKRLIGRDLGGGKFFMPLEEEEVGNRATMKKGVNKK